MDRVRRKEQKETNHWMHIPLIHRWQGEVGSL